MGKQHQKLLLTALEDKFLVDDECWEWTAGRDSGGYGVIRRDGRNCSAHRVLYELLVGPIPDGLTLDHLCRNRGCVRPSHLEPVTMKVNALRGIGVGANNAKKTHCPRGHPYTDENTRINTRGARECRTCLRART